MVKVKFHRLIHLAIALWVLTGAIAALEITSLRRVFALGAVASAVTLLAVGLNNRRLTVAGTNRVTRFVGRAIVRAPRQARWEGYGEGAADALAGHGGEDTRDLSGR